MTMQENLDATFAAGIRNVSPFQVRIPAMPITLFITRGCKGYPYGFLFFCVSGLVSNQLCGDPTPLRVEAASK
jgi:hypothetical protein